MLQIAAARTPSELLEAQQSFRALYDKWKGPIMSYLYHWTQDQRLAEDLLQETFLKVFRARESYQVSAKFSTWLWTIARNTAIDHGKRRRERWVELTPDHEETVSSDVFQDAGEAPILRNPEEEWIASESSLGRESWVRDCLAQLTPRAREVIGLRTFSEAPYEEISQVTGETLAAVKTILFRAKKSLTDCIQKKRNVNGS